MSTIEKKNKIKKCLKVIPSDEGQLVFGGSGR